MPAALRDALRDVAGAHANHQFFWKIIGPGTSQAPVGELRAAIARDFGHFETFKETFAQAARGVNGPGFAFLSLTASKRDRLEVLALPGNGSVLSIGKPGVLICDLWEHAWSADYNTLQEWLGAFWHIVDWDVCEKRYLALRAGDMPA